MFNRTLLATLFSGLTLLVLSETTVAQGAPPCANLIGGKIVDLTASSGVPAGVLVGDPDQGDTSYQEPNGSHYSGASLAIGAVQNTGCYELRGDILELPEGNDAQNGIFSRSTLNIGGTDGIGNGVGYAFLSDDAEINLTGEDSSPQVSIGYYGDVSLPYKGEGFLDISTGASLNLSVSNLLEHNYSVEEMGVALGVGVGVSTGAIGMDDGHISLAGTSGTLLVVGGGNGAVGSITAANGSTIQVAETSLAGATVHGAKVVVGAEGGLGAITVQDSTVLVVSEATAPAFPDQVTAELAIGVQGDGAFDVSGSGAELQVLSESGNAHISVGAQGNNGFGRLTVSEQALVAINSNSGGSVLQIGAQGVGVTTGAVTVESGGLVQVGDIRGGDILVGASNIDAGNFSNGTLVIDGASTRVFSGGNVVVGKKSGEGQTTGNLVLSNGGTLLSPVIEIGDGGSISGNGTLHGNTTVYAGGSIAPGFSPGSLLFDGDLTLGANSELFIEVAGPFLSQRDFLNVTGKLSVLGEFDLKLLFVGYVPDEGSEVGFLDVGGQLDPLFFDLARIDILGLGYGSEVSLFQSGDVIGFRADSVVVPAQVPLPASFPMLLVGVAGFGLLRRRAQRMIWHAIRSEV